MVTCVGQLKKEDNTKSYFKEQDFSYTIGEPFDVNLIVIREDIGIKCPQIR